MTLQRTLEPEVMDTAEEAVDYDSMDHSTVNRLFVDDLLALLKTYGRTSAGHVLDLGTGTALIPLELLRRQISVQSLLACDLSVEMLRIAVRHRQRSSNGSALIPAYCDARQLPVRTESMDVVISNSIIHHIPQPIEVLAEMKRILKPGGVLLIRDLMRPETADQVETFVQQYAGEENEHQQQMFRQSLHAALTVEEVQDMLKECHWPEDWVAATSDRHWTIAGVNE